MLELQVKMLSAWFHAGDPMLAMKLQKLFNLG